MTREERLARQEADDGDPDETVYLGKSGSAGNGVDIYHDEEHCWALRRTREIVETTRADAHRRWLAPCGHCVLDDDGGE